MVVSIIVIGLNDDNDDDHLSSYIMMISIPPLACEVLPMREKELQFQEAAMRAHSAPNL